MKTVKKNVYYCDFCKKKGLSAGHIATHEKHCTGNPERECRLCELGEDIILTKKERKILVNKANKLVNLFMKNDVKIDNFGTRTYGADKQSQFKKKFKIIVLDFISCPACILSILREAKKEVVWYADWDYKKAFSIYMDEINDRIKKDEEHAIYGY